MKSDELSVHVVWTPVLASDSFEAAQQAPELIPDYRAKHYWDNDRSLGLAYARVVELPRGRALAWDIYFTYGRGAEWTSSPPEPAYWAHQLGFDERLLLDGDALIASLEEALAETE